jgi:hypothetical protein
LPPYMLTIRRARGEWLHRNMGPVMYEIDGGSGVGCDPGVVEEEVLRWGTRMTRGSVAHVARRTNAVHDYQLQRIGVLLPRLSANEYERSESHTSPWMRRSTYSRLKFGRRQSTCRITCASINRGKAGCLSSLGQVTAATNLVCKVNTFSF